MTTKGVIINHINYIGKKWTKWICTGAQDSSGEQNICVLFKLRISKNLAEYFKEMPIPDSYSIKSLRYSRAYAKIDKSSPFGNKLTSSQIRECTLFYISTERIYSLRSLENKDLSDYFWSEWARVFQEQRVYIASLKLEEASKHWQALTDGKVSASFGAVQKVTELPTNFNII